MARSRKAKRQPEVASGSGAVGSAPITQNHASTGRGEMRRQRMSNRAEENHEGDTTLSKICKCLKKEQAATREIVIAGFAPSRNIDFCL